MLRLFRLCLLLSLAAATGAQGGEWQTFRNCRYLPNAGNDGDSFHVQAAGREYIFRLYFVDTPETDTSVPARVAEQAKYFHAKPAQTIELGHEAERFTRQRLGRPFTVRTCLQDARGRSRLPRYFALVETRQGDLGESLVANGLARVHGAASDPPGMDRAEVEWHKLERFEHSAQREKIGGWGLSLGRLSTRAATQPKMNAGPFDSSSHSKKASAQSPHADLLDINTASMEALQDIPGIGNVLAGRIIDGRPFQSADELDRIKGVGVKKYARLRPYFR